MWLLSDRSCLSALSRFLGSLSISNRVTHGRLTLYLLTSTRKASIERHYASLLRALETGSATITEAEIATIPVLLFRNTGNAPVLLRAGQELVGGCQNRVTRQPVVVGEQQEIELPVVCVERGRWMPVSEQFTGGHWSCHSVLEELHRGTDSVQDNVWSVLDKFHTVFDTHSKNQAMSELYQGVQHDLSRFQRAFPSPGNAVGVLAAIDGRSVGAQLFGNRQLLARHWDSLVAGYALEVLSRPEVQPQPVEKGTEFGRRFLNRLISAPAGEVSTPGVGTAVEVTGNGVRGSAVLHDNEVLYMSVCRVHDGDTPGDDPSLRKGMQCPGCRRSIIDPGYHRRYC